MRKESSRITARELRKKIAEAVNGGMSCKDTAKKFKVSHSTVSNSCREHGVFVPRSPPFRAFQILSRVLDGVGATELAKEFDCSRNRIYLVIEEAKKWGLIKRSPAETWTKIEKKG